MTSQYDSEFSLMDQLFESSVADLLSTNISAQKESSRMLAENNPNALEYMDLCLTPDFMKNNDGILMVSANDQKRIAELVLNELHDEWNGSEAIEYKVNDKYTEKYWEFVDVDNDFIPWTVVETHNNQPEYHETALSGYIICGPRRPVTYQKLLDEKSHQPIAENAIESETGTTLDHPNKLTQKAAKNIGKWLKKQTILPPRPNRFE